jgi:hypothetical protein
MKKQRTPRPVPVAEIDLCRVRGGVGDYEKVPANLEVPNLVVT